MKTFKTASLLLICTTFFFFACKKENPIDPVPITKHDTIRIHDTIIAPSLTRTQILVKKEWQVDQVIRNQGGSNAFYTRGGTNTTGTNYNNLKLRFNADGTGTYTDETGLAHTLAWNFTTADERNASLTIGPPSATTFIWNMIELKDNYLHSTSAYSGNNLLTARYIQIP